MVKKCSATSSVLLVTMKLYFTYSCLMFTQNNGKKVKTENC